MLYNAAVQGLRASLRVLFVLVGFWSGLIALGWIAGAIPPEQGEIGTPKRAPAPKPEALKAAVAPPAREAPSPPPKSAETPAKSVDTKPAPVLRYLACDASVDYPTLSLRQLLGDAHAEVNVGCGSSVHVWVMERGSEGVPLHMRRALSFHANAPAGHQTRAFPLLPGDIDADGIPDIVLGLRFSREGREDREGAIYVVPREFTGAFRNPARLSRSPLWALALGQLDGRPGLELIAAQGSPKAFRGDVLALYPGGRKSGPRVQIALEGNAKSVETGDFDHDGFEDVSVILNAPPRLEIVHGAANLRLERKAVFSLPGAREQVVDDFDGDGIVDLLLLRNEGVDWLRGGKKEAQAPQKLVTRAGLRSLQVCEGSGGARRDLLAFAGQKLLRITQKAALQFEEEVVLPLPADFEYRHFALTRFGGADFVILLARAKQSRAPWEVWITKPHPVAPVIAEGENPSLPAEPALALRIPLP